MPSIYFATTNPDKLLIARTVCESVGIDVKQAVLDIDEIQGEDSLKILRDKAVKAYGQLGRPLVVSDDSWSIPALNGFPGLYMKSINAWFQPQDMLRLMDSIPDRTIQLNQYLAYIDGRKTKVFDNIISGRIADGVRGRKGNAPMMAVIELNGDGGKTLAEVYANGRDNLVDRHLKRPDVWHNFVSWYKNRLEDS